MAIKDKRVNLEDLKAVYDHVDGDVSDLKSQISSAVDAMSVPYQQRDISSYYYAILDNSLIVGHVYRIGIMVETSGTYTVMIGTSANLGEMVTTLLDAVRFTANEVRYVNYTPSTNGEKYIRIDSNSVDWSVNINEIVKAEDFVNDIDSLKHGADLSYELMKTSQLFDKNEAPGYLHVNSSGAVVSSQSLARSWVVKLEGSKRYVSYVTETLPESDAYAVHLFDTLPTVGATRTNTPVPSQHSKSVREFTTTASEIYALIELNGNFSNLLTDADKYGFEQLDNGTDYKNETFGEYSVSKALVVSDNVTEETVKAIAQKAGNKLGSKWQGKKIWWCGTSIPYGKDTALNSQGYGLSYPEMVGKLLGAEVVYNEAEGSSMARRSTRTGDHANGLSYNILLALSQTAEEKESLISNWETIRQTLHDPDTLQTLDNTWKSNARNASFEHRLMPYLDGTKDMPDLFVFDHGHNDYKSYYTMPDGITPDTELQPTVANIADSILADDTFMTANNNAKLISFFGEIENIPVANRDAFVASVNRNCYIGAINFLCTLILSKNPRARIVFIGNLDNWEKPQVQSAQQAVANSWCFPLVRTWEYLGLSNHYIPNTATFWNESGTIDLMMKNIYCKDGVHPHSDTTGAALNLYAETIANALKNI